MVNEVIQSHKRSDIIMTIRTPRDVRTSVLHQLFMHTIKTTMVTHFISSFDLFSCSISFKILRSSAAANVLEDSCS